MDEKEYESLVDMFESDGWKLFISEIAESEEGLTRAAPDNCGTNEAWQYTRGRIHQLRSISGYETLIKVTQEQVDVDPV